MKSSYYAILPRDAEILPKLGPGPGEAVREFLESHPEFQPDARREKFGMTFNPGGYLRRLR